MNNKKLNADVLKTLEARAMRLSNKVERATQDSPEREVRDGGSRLADVLDEWLQDIHELHQSGDDELEERVLSFHTRLALAEKKVDTWHIPKRKRATKKKKARASRPRKRAA